MIRSYITLEIVQQQAVKDLLDQCELYDHSLVPVQYDHSLNYFPIMHSWFLSYEGEELIGVLSIFNPLSEVAEISGCILPEKRNAGKFNESIAAAKEELIRFNVHEVLFVVEAGSKQGIGAIHRAGLACDHVEYLMKYDGGSSQYSSSIQFSEARVEDKEDFIRINSALFHETIEESNNIFINYLHSNDRRLYIAKVENVTIGICTLFYSGTKVTIYGFGISEEYQGRGYGFELINAVLHLLKDESYEIELEVDSLNEKAYNLYKKAGFIESRVVNYYKKRIDSKLM